MRNRSAGVDLFGVNCHPSPLRGPMSSSYSLGHLSVWINGGPLSSIDYLFFLFSPPSMGGVFKVIYTCSY